MRPQNLRGEGDGGRGGEVGDPRGERKRGSVVDLAMSSAEPGSGVSGDCARRVVHERRKMKRVRMNMGLRPDEMRRIGREEFYYRLGAGMGERKEEELTRRR